MANYCPSVTEIDDKKVIFQQDHAPIQEGSYYIAIIIAIIMIVAQSWSKSDWVPAENSSKNSLRSEEATYGKYCWT